MNDYDKQMWVSLIASAQRKAKMYNDYMHSGGAGVNFSTQNARAIMYREARIMLLGFLIETQGTSDG